METMVQSKTSGDKCLTQEQETILHNELQVRTIKYYIYQTILLYNIESFETSEKGKKKKDEFMSNFRLHKKS